MGNAAFNDGLIVLLAAGAARRFGADKLAQPCAGRPLAHWAQGAALGLGGRVVCLHPPGAMPALLPGCEAAENPRAAEGQGTSVALAARLAAERRAPFLLIMLADMPLITTLLLRRLLALGAPACCAYPDGRPGVPALFGPAEYPALMALEGDAGAGRLLRAVPQLRWLAVESQALFDVDTPQDLARAAALLAGA